MDQLMHMFYLIVILVLVFWAFQTEIRAQRAERQVDELLERTRGRPFASRGLPIKDANP